MDGEESLIAEYSRQGEQHVQKGDGPNSEDKFVRQRVVGDKSACRKRQG